jgi:hypothetical protein
MLNFFMLKIKFTEKLPLFFTKNKGIFIVINLFAFHYRIAWIIGCK